MTKTEFCERLRRALDALPPTEVEKTVAFYSEMIDDRMEDGCDEQQATAALGDFEEIVHSVMMSHSVPALLRARMNESRRASGNRALWWTLLVLGSPLWLALAAVVFSVYVAIWALMIALYAVVGSFGLAGGICAVAGVPICFLRTVPVGLAISGAGLLLFGIALLLIRPTAYLTGALLRTTTRFAGYIKGRFIKKDAPVTADGSAAARVDG